MNSRDGNPGSFFCKKTGQMMSLGENIYHVYLTITTTSLYRRAKRVIHDQHSKFNS